MHFFVTLIICYYLFSTFVSHTKYADHIHVVFLLLYNLLIVSDVYTLHKEHILTPRSLSLLPLSFSPSLSLSFFIPSCPICM